MALDVALSPARLERLRAGAVLVPADAAIFRIEGPGAVLCLQGLLTNDLVAPGDRSLVYGALLTPKGMIVADAWVVRAGDILTLAMEPNASGPALAIFRRT
ncbi:MAG: hypothetical protein HOP28_05430, partial [Gemmatimonadales bacterium]|nr:hypothetical protein [Gemmatimonadales bacterium]